MMIYPIEVMDKVLFKIKHKDLALLEIEIRMVKKMVLEYKNGKMVANIKEIL